MIWSITKSNIKKNFSLYRIYFLATIGLLSIFIAFLNFISDKIITEKIGDSGQALVIANGSLIFLIVFLVVFLIYFNNFFVKKRSQELGVLAILGFSKKELTQLLTLENLVILVLSYLVSLLLGPTLYFLAVLVITHLLELTLEVQWFITANEIIESLGILVVVFLINVITNGLIISKQSLIEFVNFSRKAEKKIKIRKVRAITAITALLLSYILCLATVFSPTRNMLLSIGMVPVSLLIIVLVVLGTVFTIRYGLAFVVSLLKGNKKRLYRPLSNTIYPKFNYRIATKNKLLTVLGGLLTVTVSVAGMMVMLYAKLSSCFPEKEMTIRTFNGNSIRSSEAFYNQFSMVPDVISSYSKEYTVKTANIATYIFITFLSILFIICTGSILYFTSLIEIMENKEEYGYLSKLGYSKKMIHRILRYETGILFLIPVFIGIVNGGMLLIYYKYLFMDTLVAGNIIMLSLLLCLLFFLIIYGTFYVLTLRSVTSIIKN
ncbi:FtsX-like permease family protein [Streptococcus pyogenes]